ncbi:MAG: NAD(P)H-binding protein, partial [Planctomycetota bacterium]
MKVLVTGATGYIGGRLVPRLLAAGHEVRVLVRKFDTVKGRPWEEGVEVVRG